MHRDLYPQFFHVRTDELGEVLAQRLRTIMEQFAARDLETSTQDRVITHPLLVFQDTAAQGITVAVGNRGAKWTIIRLDEGGEEEKQSSFYLVHTNEKWPFGTVGTCLRDLWTCAQINEEMALDAKDDPTRHEYFRETALAARDTRNAISWAVRFLGGPDMLLFDRSTQSQQASPDCQGSALTPQM